MKIFHRPEMYKVIKYIQYYLMGYETGMNEHLVSRFLLLIKIERLYRIFKNILF